MQAIYVFPTYTIRRNVVVRCSLFTAYRFQAWAGRVHQQVGSGEYPH